MTRPGSHSILLSYLPPPTRESSKPRPQNLTAALRCHHPGPHRREPGPCATPASPGLCPLQRSIRSCHIYIRSCRSAAQNPPVAAHFCWSKCQSPHDVPQIPSPVPFYLTSGPWVSLNAAPNSYPFLPFPGTTPSPRMCPSPLVCPEPTLSSG